MIPNSLLLIISSTAYAFYYATYYSDSDGIASLTLFLGLIGGLAMRLLELKRKNHKQQE